MNPQIHGDRDRSFVLKNAEYRCMPSNHCVALPASNRIQMKFQLIGVVLLFSVALSGCLKEPGIGGNSTITGKIYAYDYNTEMNKLRAQYYAPDEDVYIIYGDDSIFSDRTQTSYDGSYRFKYLRPGTYTIFAYSKNINTKLPPLVAVRKTVEILSGNQVLTLDDIEINK
jgi:hypothetical protein